MVRILREDKMDANMKLDPETQFMGGLLELQYGVDVTTKLQELAPQVRWAKGWPNDTKAFWNAEAFMWSRKISRKIREVIQRELTSFKDGKNLDIGCGAYSYVQGSVGFDISSKMLALNDSLLERIQGDVEKYLPFSSNSFDSATAIFLCNYVKNYSGLLKEVHRVLHSKGRFVMVLSSTPINEWQRQKQVNNLSPDEWRRAIEQSGFNVDFYQKESLWFFMCKKMHKPQKNLLTL